MSQSVRGFLSAVLVSLISGCIAPTYTVLVSKDESVEAPALTDFASVDVSRFGDAQPAAFEIVGNVYVGGRGTSVFGLPNDKGLETHVRQAAATLGADGILGYYTRKVSDAERWATGLAIRRGPLESRGNASPLAIALWPIKLPEELQKDAAEIHELVTNAARRTLAPKGYFLYPLDPTLAQPGVIEEGVQLPADAQWIDLILFVELGEFDEDYKVITRTRTTGMSGNLHSRSKGIAIWEDDVESEQGVFSLLNSLLGVGDKKKSAALAMENLLATLPTLASPAD